MTSSDRHENAPVDVPPAAVAEPNTPLGSLPPPLAEVVTVRHGRRVEHELVLTPGASAADVTTAMIMVPPSAALVAQRGGTGPGLVFREVPDDRPGRRSPDPRP